MSLASNKLLKTIHVNEKPDTKQTRLAVITGYGSTTKEVYVKFHGEEEASQIRYKYPDHVTGLRTGDRVMLTKINNSYIISGKV